MAHVAQDRPHVVKDARGKRPVFYRTEGLDEAMSMIMVLANEISVIHDRLDSVERVASQHGIDLAAGVEALVLDQPALEAREAWRQDFLERIFYLIRKDAQDVAQKASDDSYRATITEIADS